MEIINFAHRFLPQSIFQSFLLTWVATFVYFYIANVILDSKLKELTFPQIVMYCFLSTLSNALFITFILRFKDFNLKPFVIYILAFIIGCIAYFSYKLRTFIQPEEGEEEEKLSKNVVDFIFSGIINVLFVYFVLKI